MERTCVGAEIPRASDGAIVQAVWMALVVSIAACSGAMSHADGGDGAAMVDTGQSVDAGSRTDVGTAVDSGSAGPDAGPADSGTTTTCGSSATRDAIQQPFASDSIWNMPIGNGATYAALTIAPASSWGGVSVDEDVLILTPTESAVAVEHQPNWELPRCTPDSSTTLFQIPTPASFVINDTMGTPNGCLAGLLADGRTIVAGQPYARCTAGGNATITYTVASTDLYGPGITGSHGGSGLSAYGGTLRVGELRPGGCPPRHALKLEFDGTPNYARGQTSSTCYRWPATQCDADGPGRYAGSNVNLLPGALLAIPASTDISTLGLETAPARQLAWTLQNYGAYVVDDTAWSVYGLCTERGPAGSFYDQFQSDWGFSMSPQPVAPTDSSPGSQWTRDINRLVAALAAVTNNGPSSIGGGGTPRQPLAPAIVPP